MESRRSSCSWQPTRGAAGESTCKPDSVRDLAVAGRSSIWDHRRRWPRAAYPRTRTGRPRTSAQVVGRSPPPFWPCSGWGLPSRPGHPGRWWSLTPPFHPYRPGGPAVFSLWHCPAGRPGWVLPTTPPCGVRTFLGTVAGTATVQPARPPHRPGYAASCDLRDTPRPGGSRWRGCGPTLEAGPAAYEAAGRRRHGIPARPGAPAGARPPTLPRCVRARPATAVRGQDAAAARSPPRPRVDVVPDPHRRAEHGAVRADTAGRRRPARPPAASSASPSGSTPSWHATPTWRPSPHRPRRASTPACCSTRWTTPR